MKALSLLLLISFLLQACAFPSGLHSSRSRLPPPETPQQFYKNIRPVGLSGSAFETWSKRGSDMESDTTFPEDKSEKTQVIVIGTVAGLALVAGIVIPLVLLKR